MTYEVYLVLKLGVVVVLAFAYGFLKGWLK